jgi:hypothetical protein
MEGNGVVVGFLLREDEVIKLPIIVATCRIDIIMMNNTDFAPTPKQLQNYVVAILNFVV